MTATRLRTRLAAATVAGVILTLSGLAPAVAADEVVFADSSLRSCVIAALGPGTPTPLTSAQLASLTTLDCGTTVVRSLGGLEAAINLRILALVNPEIQTLDPLAGLTKLESVTLSDSRSLTDISGLADKPTLATVELAYARPASIEPLATLPSLRALDLHDTDIADLSALSELSALEDLDLSGNGITDVAPLAELVALTRLDLSGNAIADATPLRSVTAAIDLGRQSLDGGAVAYCTAVAPPAILGRAGTKAVFTAGTFTTAYGFASGWLIAPGGSLYGYKLLSFATTDGLWGEVRYVPTGYSGLCAWPSAFAAIPSISGTAVQGGTLEAAVTVTGGPVQWGTAETTMQWNDATTDAYLGWGDVLPLGEATVGTRPAATFSIFAPGMVRYDGVSAPAQRVLALLPELAVKLQNGALVGYPLTTVPVDLPLGTATKCRYLVDGVVSATRPACDLVVPDAWWGKKVAVEIEASASGYATRRYTTPPATVVRSFGPAVWVFAIDGAPAGTTTVGRALTANPPEFATTPTGFVYQWRRDGHAITGATARTYVTTASDGGHRVSVAITAKRSGYQPATWVAWDVSVSPLFGTAPKPIVSGSPVVGAVLSAASGGWSPTPSSIAYQWFRNGRAIAGATSATYRTTSYDQGRTVQVKTTAHRAGLSPTTTTSAGVAVQGRLIAGAPTLTGSFTVGQTAKVSPGTWGPGDVSRTYGWKVNGTYTGHHGYRYTFEPKDAFATVVVKVTGSKTGYATATRWTQSITVQGLKYSSCYGVRKHYPGGIAYSGSKSDLQAGLVIKGLKSTTFVSKPLYTLNAVLDTDKDGWICE
ncbi:leucine-rich repeat domain-containing protein [Demequina sp.]|uniref:leucine-rich repeat domain-containing protein n=1 Tax=Demequina sp. TaxID=2050685 RepID=UPI0025CCD236|nr:leucine-rich repeat domain-containing protein [Demequina sp.]